MRWVVPAVVLLLMPLVQAAPVPAGDVEFHFYRDAEAGSYTITPQADAPYSVGFWGNGATYADGGRDWAFMFSDLDGPFRLDAAGQIAVTLYVGGGVQQDVVPESGVASVGWRLIVGGEAVASGDEQDITYSGSAEQITWSVAAPDATIGNGAMLRVYTTAHTGLGGRMDLEPSSLVLPVLEGAVGGGEMPVSYENVTAETVNLNFTDATEIQHLDWTVQRDAGEFVAVWDVRNGSLNLTVTSPANETLHEGEAAGIGNTTAIVEGAAGVWRITLHATDLTGDVSFVVAAVQGSEEGPGPDGTGATGPNGTTGTQHNSTGNATVDGSGKESPGLPLLLVVAGLVAAVRRRW